ncbi:hypothetical protein [Azonexus sp.]|uniref:hypothetical protein n=1 Tax=Azonexus sp. TaxID=1872668 RepID=UPI0039E2809F
METITNIWVFTKLISSMIWGVLGFMTNGNQVLAIIFIGAVLSFFGVIYTGMDVAQTAVTIGQ